MTFYLPHCPHTSQWEVNENKNPLYSHHIYIIFLPYSHHIYTIFIHPLFVAPFWVGSIFCTLSFLGSYLLTILSNQGGNDENEDENSKDVMQIVEDDDDDEEEVEDQYMV